MKKLNKLLKSTFLFIGLFFSQISVGQIFQPEGLNMPGAWNSWTNPPSNNLSLASSSQVPGGRVSVITSGDRRYQTIFNTVSEVPSGSHQFKFTSGGGNPWANEWAQGVTVAMNSFQTYGMGGSNANITLASNRWYTMNWRDVGYTTTTAIFMETTSEPVQITGVSQSPIVGSVTPSNSVTVTANTNNSLSPEERLYLRYTTNNFSTSTLVQFTMSGNSGTAVIPAQTNGTQVNYYVFSSTLPVASIGTNYDMATIRLNNNGGSYVYTSTSVPPVNVTFRVNMSNETVGGSVNIAGSFNGWIPQAMTNEGGGIYALTTSLAQGASIQYKFVNGSTYEGNLGAPCGNGNDRTYTVPSSDATIPTVCFSSCSNCIPTVPVTFRVDMNQQTVSGNGVHIAGNFQGWNPSGSPMTNSGGGIYTRTFNLVEGQTYEYKFINGNDWPFSENVPGACANGSGNRTFTVPVGGGNVPLVCYASCSSCPAMVNVTFQVDMSQQTVSGNGVHIAGEFQGWNPSGSPMTNSGGGIYTRTFSLPEGTTLQYKFINGNAWINEETVPGGCNTSGNRTVTVPIGGGTLPLVCFGSCTSCSPIMVNVTFQVDMSQQSVSGNGVHIAGDFQGWNPSGSTMTNSGGGIYTRTFSLAQGTTVQYKFINGNAWGSDESVPGPCNTSGNRTYNVPVGGGTIPVVCYGSCSACPVSIQSVASGAWESTSTWNTGVVPSPGADVTISAGNTITINNPTTIGVATINGTLVANQNLTITGGGTVAGQLTIASNAILSVPSSTLNSTGMITLKSGASLLHGSGTTSFTGGAVTGNFRMERQGFSGVGYSFMSAPMQNVNIAGIGVKRYSYTTSNGSSTITAGVPDPGWTLIPGAATMQQSVGYAILTPGLAVMTGTNPREGTTNITVSVPGGSTNNMNLLGNPFPSAISASAFMTTNGPAGVGAIDGTIYYWDNPTPFSGPYQSSDYATWNGAGGIGGGGNTPNGTIGAGQGFFVRGLINNQTVSFTNNMRVTNNAQFFDQTHIERVRISLTSASQYNETLIAFLDEATEEFDNRFDSEKFMGNPSLALYSKLNNQKLAIQSFGLIQQPKSVGLGIQTTLSETLTLKLKELENFNETVNVILEDRETGHFQNLRIINEYVFTPGSMDMNDRFVLHFSAPISLSVNQATCDAKANIQLQSVGNNLTVKLKNESGIVLSQTQLIDQAEFTQLNAGTYYLEYVFADGYTVNTSFEVNPIQTISIESALPQLIEVNQFESLQLMSGISGAEQISWYLNNVLISESEQINLNLTDAGTYELMLLASTSDCAYQQSIQILVNELLVNGLTNLDAAAVSVYPNPASGLVFISSTMLQNQNVVVKLYDMSMREVLSEQKNLTNGLIELNLQNLANGVYSLTIQSSKGITAKRIIKN